MAFHSGWIIDDEAATGSGAVHEIFPWWSFTKTVIAVAALRLVEVGKLQLDAPRPGKRYSLRQLLLHRAGVPNYGRLQDYHWAVARGEDAWPRERLLEAVNAEVLDFEPGEQWNYSNVGYLFVRDAIEEAAGVPLAEALQECVLRPLRLESVRLATTRADFEAIFWTELRDYDPRWVYHGCLIGTPLDAARLLHELFRGKLLRPSSVAAIFERSTILDEAIPGRPWKSMSYASGLMSGTMAEAGRAWGHSGGGPHSANAVYHFPDLGRPVTVATFTNEEAAGPAEFEALKLAMRVQNG
jgi:D-alanyl-D-alanine carboxypeptidase